MKTETEENVLEEQAPPAEEATPETETISKVELQRLRSMAGSASTRVQQDALLQRIQEDAAEARREAKMARRFAEMNISEPDPEERERKLSALSAEERETQEKADVTRRIQAFNGRSNRKAALAGLTTDNPRIVKARALHQRAWAASNVSDAEALLEEAEDEIDAAFAEAMDAKEAAAKKRGDDLDNELKTIKAAQRQEERAKAGDMSTGTPAGGGGKKQFTRAELAAMSPEDYAKNRDAILR